MFLDIELLPVIFADIFADIFVATETSESLRWCDGTFF